MDDFWDGYELFIENGQRWQTSNQGQCKVSSWDGWYYLFIAYQLQRLRRNDV